MHSRMWYVNFLIGSEDIGDRIEYKQAILRGQLALLLLSVCLIYLIIDPLNGLYAFIPLYIITGILSGVILLLNRARKPILAASLLLLASNALIFVIADTGNPDRGIYIFFIVSAVVGLGLFYHLSFMIGVLFSLLSVSLAIIAFLFDFNFYDYDVYAEDQTMQISFIINMIIGTLSAIIVILFMIRRNKESEESLLKNQKELEKRTAELAKKNKELQKANEELDRFVYSASHDLRAPLTTLLGLIEVFKLSDNEEDQLKFLQMMTSRIEDMEGFIRDITDYSRNSRMEVVHRSVNMLDFLEEVKDSFNFLSSEVGVKINIIANSDIVEYSTDPSRLKVAVNNVVANAIKYCDPGKEKRLVNISLDNNDGGFRIEIEDNGVGIPEQYHSKIFDMFFRASDNSKGSGLGLYIVRETLEKINGKISFSSKLSKGSKFIIELMKN